jgi:hypothetical protein
VTVVGLAAVSAGRAKKAFLQQLELPDEFVLEMDLESGVLVEQPASSPFQVTATLSARRTDACSAPPSSTHRWTFRCERFSMHRCCPDCALLNPSTQWGAAGPDLWVLDERSRCGFSSAQLLCILACPILAVPVALLTCQLNSAKSSASRHHEVSHRLAPRQKRFDDMGVITTQAQ